MTSGQLEGFHPITDGPSGSHGQPPAGEIQQTPWGHRKNGALIPITAL